MNSVINEEKYDEDEKLDHDKSLFDYEPVNEQKS
jgi:hypothetical protein